MDEKNQKKSVKLALEETLQVRSAPVYSVFFRLHVSISVKIVKGKIKGQAWQMAQPTLSSTPPEWKSKLEL